MFRQISDNLHIILDHEVMNIKAFNCPCTFRLLLIILDHCDLWIGHYMYLQYETFCFSQHIYQTFHLCFTLCHTAPNNGGVIAAAVISVLLILIIIAIILFCCYRSRHRKKYEKEICNEIRYFCILDL